VIHRLELYLFRAFLAPSTRLTFPNVRTGGRLNHLSSSNIYGKYM